MTARDHSAIRQAEPAEAFSILALLYQAFAGMTGRIDPPSSLLRLTEADVRNQAARGGIFVTGPPEAPTGCLFVTPQQDCTYLGKLATAPTAQGTGIARALVTHAARTADPAKPLRLQTRVELVENHAVFERLGFKRVAQTAHPGYDRATSYTYERMP